MTPELDEIMAAGKLAGFETDIFDAMVILNQWDKLEAKPVNLTEWIKELYTEKSEDIDDDYPTKDRTTHG